MAQPSLMIVPIDHVDSMSRVLEAMGRGPNTFDMGTGLVAKGTTGPVLFKIAQDTGADEEFSSVLRFMAETGQLPQLDVEWGQNGTISQALGKEALKGFVVFSVAGNINIQSWRDSILDSLELEIETLSEEN